MGTRGHLAGLRPGGPGPKPEPGRPLHPSQPHRRRRAEQGTRRQRRGVTRFSETGSGVLVSSDGRVMTAAHVVNGMDEITVEAIEGEVVRATIISANAIR